MAPPTLNIDTSAADAQMERERIPAKNRPYVKAGAHGFNTKLSTPEEQQFRAWLQQNKVPFDPEAPTTDYDMRGFWRALKAGDPKAKSAIDPNDTKLHYPDFWKTPLHKTFSNESQWATPDAPHWTNDDKLIDKHGKVLFDDRANRPKAPAGPQSRNGRRGDQPDQLGAADMVDAPPDQAAAVTGSNGPEIVLNRGIQQATADQLRALANANDPKIRAMARDELYRRSNAAGV